MNYSQTLEWLFSQLPMYQRIGGSAYKADLSNTIRLMSILDNPEKKFRSVHIAGTNGKGSVSHMLAAVFQEAGYKTGLYTSPHLTDFRERIKINGEMISQKVVVDFLEQNKKGFKELGLSFFEMTVGLAFDCFAREKVDIAIVETGMGGRLDSTNVIVPVLSIITNISKDHSSFLGEDIPTIALEKAGIIKDEIPVLIGEEQSETTPVFIKAAKAKKAPLHFAGKMIPTTAEITTDLKGEYQVYNLKTVLAAVDILEQIGFNLKQVLKPSLGNIRRLTNFRGRWEVLQIQPTIICDTAHNEAGIKAVIAQLQNMKFRQLHIVLGMVADKDIIGILAILPRNAIYYFCRPDIPRGLSQEELMKRASGFNLRGSSHPSVKAALESAEVAASRKDLIFAGGSTFVVAEVLPLFD